MTNRLHRLESLSRAQSKFAKALEVRLGQHERRLGGLLETRLEISRLADGAAATDPASMPRLLQSLAVTELSIKQLQKDIEDLRRELQSTRGREKVISTKYKSLREAEERKVAESQSLEAALVMTARACSDQAESSDR